MKKNNFLVLGVAILALVISSCGKTTKGKLVNDWTVDSEVVDYTYLDDDNYTEESTKTFQDGKYTYKYVATDDGSVVDNELENGLVKSYTFSIKKDGTFEIYQEYTKEYTDGSYDLRTIKQSGIWSFVKNSKADEFKKNEVIMFDVLSKSENYKYYYNDALDDEDEYSYDYVAGNNSFFYWVESSSSKELTLKSETIYEDKDDNGSWGKNTRNTTLVLKK